MAKKIAKNSDALDHGLDHVDAVSVVRRHMGRAQNRKGFGWKRWSRRWLYETLRLFNGYRVRRPMPKVAPAG